MTDLFAEVAEFATAFQAERSRSKPSAPIPLSQVQPGMYGEVSFAWGPDGSVQKDDELAGFVTSRVRVYTGGIIGHSKGPKRRGERLLYFSMDVTGSCFVGFYCPPDATFTVLDPPEGHRKPREAVRYSGRPPVADLRRGDVFYIYDEPGLEMTARPGRRDDRPRYHVQADAGPVVNGRCDVEILVGGQGKVVSRRYDAYRRVDVEDPREVAWHGAQVAEPQTSLFDWAGLVAGVAEAVAAEE